MASDGKTKGKGRVKSYARARVAEPSSWLGLGLLALASGTATFSQTGSRGLAIGAAAAALLGILMPERGTAPPTGGAGETK